MSVPIPGPYAQNYEDYIGKIFRPANSKLLISTALSEYSQATEGEKIPASIQLKHERDNDAIWEPSPLESMFSLYETSGLDDPMPKYPVYEPKRSSEYYSIANKKPLVTESSAMAYKVARTRDGLNVYNKPSSYDETTYTLKPDARRFQPNYKAKYFLVFANLISAQLSIIFNFINVTFRSTIKPLSLMTDPSLSI